MKYVNKKTVFISVAVLILLCLTTFLVWYFFFNKKTPIKEVNPIYKELNKPYTGSSTLTREDIIQELNKPYTGSSTVTREEIINKINKIPKKHNEKLSQ